MTGSRYTCDTDGVMVMKHASDGGSVAQIKRFSARITQITEHLRQNKKDYSGRRGLMRIIGQRKRLLTYLRRTDVEAYQLVMQETGIRQSSH